MNRTTVREELFSMQDLQYRDFHSKLMPTVKKEQVIGVRVPMLRKYARRIAGTALAADFLRELPHFYYEENNLHAFLIEQIADYAAAIAAVDRFLPYVDNWATCDMLHPKVFGKNTERLFGEVERWMRSEKVYTVRFGIGMLMRYYLDEAFREAHLERVARVSGEDYYIRMMVAWFFATALAKQYDATLRYFTDLRLDVWTHNKAIQKAIESRRIPDAQKEVLRALKR